MYLLRRSNGPKEEKLESVKKRRRKLEDKLVTFIKTKTSALAVGITVPTKTKSSHSIVKHSRIWIWQNMCDILSAISYGLYPQQERPKKRFKMYVYQRFPNFFGCTIHLAIWCILCDQLGKKCEVLSFVMKLSCIVI